MRKVSLGFAMAFELRAFPMYASQSDSAAEHLVCQGAWVPVRRRRRHTRRRAG
jgi:hypothetical protein